MTLLRFEIRYADGRKEIATVDAERALIGNGAHCDVRLPIDQAANEHVAVEVVGGTVRVETKAFEPPATVNGLPFTTIPMTPDVPLKVGSTRIFISLAEDGFENAPVVQKKAEETSPFMKVLGVLVLVAGAYMMFMDNEPPAAVAPAQAPDLFPTRPLSCSEAAPDQARALAADKLEVAQGKRERSPFVAKDGIQAVQLYDLASACFRQAGDASRADETDAQAAQLRQAITQDFRARRVRLEHLMAVGDYELAKQDVTVLRALTEGKQGPWMAWLASANQLVKQKAPRK